MSQQVEDQRHGTDRRGSDVSGHRVSELVARALHRRASRDADAEEQPRRDAAARLGDLVAAGGTLIVLARAREPGEVVDGPPWALTRAEIDALAGAGLEPAGIEELDDPRLAWPRRWRAEFRRPAR